MSFSKPLHATGQLEVARKSTFSGRYFLLSLVFFVVFTFALHFYFDTMMASALQKYWVASAGVFYFTFVVDIFFYFYFLKNYFLNRIVYYFIISVFRFVLAGLFLSFLL